MKDPKYAVWLQCALGQGGMLPAEILRRFSSFQNFYESGAQEWKLSGLFNVKQLDRLEHTPLQDAQIILQRCGQLRQTVLSLENSAYPDRLKQICDPPAVLYATGNLPDFDRRICIAAVSYTHLDVYKRQTPIQLISR